MDNGLRLAKNGTSRCAWTGSDPAAPSSGTGIRAVISLVFVDREDWSFGNGDPW